MAFYTNKLDSRPEKSAAHQFFGGIAAFFERLMEAQTRSNEVRRMQNLSDAELAKLGVSRENIVRQVYRDVYYV